MNNGRLFTFGCSFTRYVYPTWADIVGKSWLYHENWGNPGSGNQYIFNSVVECLQKTQFTKQDCIMIMWTGVARTDIYQFGVWRSKINEFSKRLEQFENCPDGYEILSYAWIHAIHELLQYRNVTYRSMSWNKYDDQSDAGKLYQETLKKIQIINFELNSSYYVPPPSLFLRDRLEMLYHNLAGPEWPSLDAIMRESYKISNSEIEQEIQDFITLYRQDRYFEQFSRQHVDTHPTPMAHLDAVKKFLPDIVVETNTEQWIREIDYKLITGEMFDFKSPTPVDRL